MCLQLKYISSCEVLQDSQGFIQRLHAQNCGSLCSVLSVSVLSYGRGGEAAHLHFGFKHKKLRKSVMEC